MPVTRQTGEKRREQILEAAFALANTRREWSLAEVADRIGVSKTALYRHFKSRAEIEGAMAEAFTKSLADAFERSDGTPDGIRASVVAFLREKPGYLHVFMENLASKDSYDLELAASLRKASPIVDRFMARIDNADGATRERLEAALLKNSASIMVSCAHPGDFPDLRDELLVFLRDGIPGMRLPTERRYAECERAARVDRGEVEGGSRLYDAIAQAVREQGVMKATIERIAEKMGTAKSSLYFYSKNKDAMIAELIRNETETIGAILARRVPFGKTFAEQLFIVMSAQANYLLLKPDMFAVFDWIRYESAYDPGNDGQCGINAKGLLDLFRLEGEFGNGKAGSDRAFATIKLAASLGTSVVIQATRRGEGTETILRRLRAIHESVLRGDKEIK